MLTQYIVQVTILAIAANALTEHEHWKIFKGKFNKSYKNALEERTRNSIFLNNLETIESHNKKYEAGLVSYKMGVNQFADMTKEEFVSRLTYKDHNRTRSGNIFQLPAGTEVPKEMNWVKLGAVTPVKDQGECGSCWSFSATGCLEGQHFIKYKQLISLSEQNLVDCSGKYGNLGCVGGYMDQAFDYVHDSGIMAEKDYAYEGISGKCRYNESKSILKVESYVDIKVGSEIDLQQAVATAGPVSVAINAGGIFLYSEGVYDETSCANDKNSLDHGILAVGYGTTENGVDYWLVKNSWGTSWGEAGYIRMRRNNNNLCGIATLASFANIQSRYITELF